MSDPQSSEPTLIPGLAGLSDEASRPPEDAGPDGDSTQAATSDDMLLTGDSSPRRSPMAGMLLIVLVLVVAGGALFAMRQIGTKGLLKLTTIEVEIPDTTDQSARFAEIMHDIQSTGREIQVPISNVKKNPFFIETDEVPVVAQNDDEEAARRAEEEARLKRIRQVQQALGALELQSIAGGKRPLAIINGTLHQVGDRVAELFRLRAIDDRSVTLSTDEGETYTLTLAEEL
jgi:hypothetical protein